jgi:3-dehydroquinate synthase
MEHVQNGNRELLQEYIRWSNQIKKGLIEQDERGEKGPRLLLDWGHTITYALEKALDYSVSHGWALGIGMMGSALLSVQLGYMAHDDMESLRRVIVRAGLPICLPPTSDLRLLIRLMDMDQKTREGKKRFVLLKKFGEAFVSDPLDDEVILTCLKKLI